MGKGSKFATNKGGIIKGQNNVRADSPKATVTKGNDLRDGKKK